MKRLSLMACMDILNICFRYQNDKNREAALSVYEKYLDNAQKAGFTYVEVLSYETDVFDAEEIRKLQEKREMKTSGYVWFGDLINTDQKQKETIAEAGKAAADKAVILGAEYFMLAPIAFSGIENYFSDQEPLILSMIRNMTDIAAYATSKGLICVIENIDDLRIPMSRPVDYRRILQEVPDLYAVFDTGNTLLSDVDTVTYYSAVKDKIRMYHIKDMRTAGTDELACASPSGKKFTCTVAGEGLVDYPKLFTSIRQDGCIYPMVIETVCPPGRKTEECYSVSLNNVIRILEES